MFGTNLSTNTARTPPSRKSSIKKIVRVRRTPKSSTSKAKRTPNSSPSRSSTEYTVVFLPGPVGLQLEPVAEDPKYGCRVVRFVDGGPNNPGQARKSGKIKPGDLVIQVEAENDVASNYEEIIQVLKKTHAKRELIFHSVWDSSFLETQSSLKLQFQSTNKPPLKNSPPRKEEGLASSTKQVPMSTPSAENASAEKSLTPFSQAEAFFLREPATPLPPPIFGSKKPLPIKPNHNEMDSTMAFSLIKSPSEVVLLSHVLTNLEQRPNKREEKRVESNGPIIIPLTYMRASPVPPPSTFLPVRREMSRPPLSAPPSSGTPLNSTLNDSTGNSPEQSKFVVFTPSPPASGGNALLATDGSTSPTIIDSPVAPHSPLRLTSILGSPTAVHERNSTPDSKQSTDSSTPVTKAKEDAPLSTPQEREKLILRTPAKFIAPSDRMQTTPFSPSNVKKLSRKNQVEKRGPRMVSRILGTVYNNVAPAVAISSYAIGSAVASKIAPAVASSSYAIGSAVTTKIGEAIVGNSSLDFQKANNLKLQLLQELSHAKASLDIQDISKQELERNMNELFRENLSLRAEFEQKLQVTRVEHVSEKI
jgi:hypothetical protein